MIPISAGHARRRVDCLRPLRNFWLSLVLLAFCGFGMMQQMAASMTIIQTIVEEGKRGRVMSYSTVALVGMAPFGSFARRHSCRRDRRAKNRDGQRRVLPARRVLVLNAN